jgi:uncharacterized membrane protein (UPF0127 family)
MDTTALTLGTQNLNLYLADTPRDWRQGLAGADLDGVDGMLFRFSSDVHLAFHMDGVDRPILIAFFTSNGDFVDLTYLGLDAQSYRPDRPYRYALELVGEHAHEPGAFSLLPALVAGIVPP